MISIKRSFYNLFVVGFFFPYFSPHSILGSIASSTNVCSTMHESSIVLPWMMLGQATWLFCGSMHNHTYKLQFPQQVLTDRSVGVLTLNESYPIYVLKLFIKPLLFNLQAHCNCYRDVSASAEHPVPCYLRIRRRKSCCIPPSNLGVWRGRMWSLIAYYHIRAHGMV